MKSKTRGYIIMPDEIAERTDLTAAQKIVLCAIGRIQGRKASCYPSINYMAKATGMSDRAVQYAIKDLVKKKEVTRVYGNYQASSYSARWAVARNLRQKWAELKAEAKPARTA